MTARIYKLADAGQQGRGGHSPRSVPATVIPIRAARFTTVELRGACRPIAKRDLDAIFAPRQFPPLDRLEGPPRNVTIESYRGLSAFIAIACVWLSIGCVVYFAAQFLLRGVL